MPVVGRRIVVRGVVQGVGFRPFVYQLAHRDGVAGRVSNDSTGVTIEAFAEADALDTFVAHLRSEAPPASVVRDIESAAIDVEPVSTFTIAQSAPTDVRNVSIPPELATCDDCLREMFDPADRRYRYPFTNCTNCGPRYSIVRDIPYDRDKTTMASFAMCDDCRSEYENPLDRRFHAQPNACPKCGPSVTATRPDGVPVATDDPIAFVARLLRAQMIAAIKGLGGFHLACDAKSSTAVQRLRERKHRDAKPLAIMVRDLDQAREFALVDETEERLLASVERPIVLLRRREGARLAKEVCGDNPLVGVFLPYTPLHHILLRAVDVPLVMTSGNVSEEPMAYRNSEALASLGEIADVFLFHDRDIETRVDDSVARVIAGRPTLVRRARGYVPRSIQLERSFDAPVLACGAHLKNAICIGSGSSAYLGPHIGDLETVETLRSFEASVEQMKRFIGVDAKVVAYDLHPEYFSTRYALGLDGVETIGVQHHHAHIVAAKTEHGIAGRVIGFAYDGTGYGLDGTSWGGEMMVADEVSFERVASFRAIPLAGGDQAVRQVWRVALAMLDDAFDGRAPLDRIELFRAIPARTVSSIRQMIAGGLNTPRARGVGRYFDAFGAIGLALSEARYEGEVAFLWNMAAAAGHATPYPYALDETSTPWEVDLRSTVRAAVADLLDGVAPSVVSGRFHATVSDLTVVLARLAAVRYGDLPVVLSGGCFNNALLAESIIDALSASTRVVMSHDIPPGDGGIALGQAVIADATVRSRSAASTTSAVEAPLCV